MFKNYLITAFNNLLKNRLYTLINISGLAIGLAACIMIGLYVLEEFSYDTQWENTDDIYRVNFSYRIPGNEMLKLARAPTPAIPAVRQYFSDEIIYAARDYSRSREIVIGDQKFEEFLAQVDPDFINLFQFEVLAGSLENTLTSTANVALSETVANRFFGTEEPVGKVITLRDDDSATDLKVTAVFRIPGNTVIRTAMMALLDDTSLPPISRSWGNATMSSYLQLKPDANPVSMASRAADMIDRNFDPSQVFPDPGLAGSDVLQMSLQNIRTAHLESPFDQSRPGGNKVVVLSFAAVSILVLLIGCINFTILTTAKAVQRAREVALRKVVGANRMQLVLQFLGESYVIVAMAMVLALGLVELGLPVFEAIVNKRLVLDYVSAGSWLSLLSLFTLVGLCGGLYPAFILSHYRPAGILKTRLSTGASDSMSLRNVLVVFQFAVSIMLIIATGVIYAQLLYSMNRDPGYNRDNLLVINQLRGNEALAGRLQPLKQELLAQSTVSAVAISEVQPSEQFQRYFVFTKVGEQEGTSYTIARNVIGYEYFSTYQIPFIAGRDYDQERDLPMPPVNLNTVQVRPTGPEPVDRNIVINVSAVRELGFASPEAAIGQVLNMAIAGNINFTIIGVVADNHLFSINAQPRPETYIVDPEFTGNNVITVRFQGTPQQVLDQVNAAWTKVAGDAELSTVFVDQLLAGEFRQEQTEVRVISSFSLLAILIACLGLYGSAAYTVDRRTKEIGIRKVMGAEVREIVSLLMWQFSKPLLIANVIAWPAAVWAMLTWLQRFPYQIDTLLLIPLCVLAGAIALSIAWLTVAGNTVKVATTNPVYALRYE